LILLLLIPYILYVWFIIQHNQGSVDYETFMRIGQRFIDGDEIWGENSYYPFPYVMIFALFSWLPRPIGMLIWHLAPVMIALAISAWDPWILAFAPLFGHMVGGQTAVFAMLGTWGYRRHADSQAWQGGMWLALTLLKPQLGLVPIGWAIIQWWRFFHRTKLVPRQAWSCVATTAIIYLPGFILMPDWLLRWLSVPRPLFLRALSGFIPRTLLVCHIQGPVFLVILLTLAVLTLWLVWCVGGRQIDFDSIMLWGYVVNPLVHDYDLIQLLPCLYNSRLRCIAALLSIPGWLVILFAYANDMAWYVFTIIAPGLLFTMLLHSRKLKKPK
jgi:hypothetical protein